MKKVLHLACFVLITVSMTSYVYGQCEECAIHPRRILRPEFERYHNYYDDNFRKGVDVKHSISVDFSKQAIIDFYNSNFGSSSDEWGVDIYFVSLHKNYRTGQKHPNQLGLVLVGSNAECKSQFGRLMIGNNTFDQSITSYQRPKGRRRYTREILNTQHKRYETIFRNSADKNDHSLSVRFPLKSFKEFVGALQDPTNDFEGLRFTFGSYNLRDQACGQQSPNQITILISPIKTDGDIGIEEFYKYLKSKLKHLADKDFEDFFNTLNHGTLCPTQCPDEG